MTVHLIHLPKLYYRLPGNDGWWGGALNSRRPLKPLHLDRLSTFAGFGDVITVLHAHQCVHRNPKGLFKA